MSALSSSFHSVFTQEEPEHPIIYTFVHVPKSGGTAVENYFLKHYSDRIFGTTHKWIASVNNNPIVIIRDPVERFVSVYHYWKNGSHGRNARGSEFNNKYGNYSLKDFVELVKNDKKSELVVGYMWRLHYYSQTYWIPKETYPHCIIITYVPDLNHKIHALLEYCKIPDKNIPLDRSNITRVKQGEEKVTMDEEDIEWLKTHFKDDFELWDWAHNSPDKFKKVI